ncbi:Hsp20/alpha crystallin family protein [Methanomethylovorans sp.]|uniref:Hsp20/alpha crystallin family protein n=1 Tax=Methanomethylovorans sp. TaxID=2758717 RepID=UPI002FDCB975
MDDKKKHSFDEDFDKSPIMDIEQLIQHLLSMFSRDADDLGESFIYGYTIFQKVGEKPDIQGFKIAHSSFSEDEDDEEGDIYINNTEPVVEVFETEDTVYVTAELGVDEEYVEFSPSADALELVVIAPNFGYSKVLELPVPVDPNTSVYTCRNGVFEISLKRTCSE